MIVVIYARVSTTDQNCAMQVHELREYCARRGWSIAAEFIDTGWSGSRVSRPQFDLLMAAARLRTFDAVVVWKLDRWGRSLAHLVSTIQELDGLGVRFVAATQGIDTAGDNPMARLLLHLMGSFAEFERELIRERVLAGMARAKALGKHTGRPRVILNRERIWSLRDKGQSIRFIASKLRLSHGTVQRVIATRPPHV